MDDVKVDDIKVDSEINDIDNEEERHTYLNGRFGVEVNSHRNVNDHMRVEYQWLAVGKDPNDQNFAIAFAMVENETKETWR
ncbi:unnamed protein product [Sphenostylis stenocarpa]|uniref:Uncharacterized protein n=1 Tax=Sphenostylis stenocarpa TaxID=92480 RepID=A0AA86SAE4_9FABA|nr:unnamed protein product [Sphenostylis stenocarpa]